MAKATPKLPNKKVLLSLDGAIAHKLKHISETDKRSQSGLVEAGLKPIIEKWEKENGRIDVPAK